MGKIHYNNWSFKAVMATLAIFGLSVSSLAGQQLRFESGDFDPLQTKYAVSKMALRDATAISADVLTKLQTGKTFVLQFNRPLTFDEQKAIEADGLTIVRYVPDDAYLVRGSYKQVQAYQAVSSALRAVMPYNPQFRVSNELQMRSVFDLDTVKTVTVRLFDDQDAQSFSNYAKELGLVVQSIGKNSVTVTGKNQVIKKLSLHSGVEWIEPKRQMELRRMKSFEELAARSRQAMNETRDEGGNNPVITRGDYTDLDGMESGTRVMNIPKAWDKGYTGKGQIIAASDTGLDTGDKNSLKEDFVNFHSGYALGVSSNTWKDTMGHGTHVLGSVGGAGNSSQKIIRGGSYEASLVMQSLWSQPNETLTTPEDLGDIFVQAYDVGARIHTNSWGDPGAEGIYDKSCEDVDRFLWSHPDMLILFAAGNDGMDMDRDGRIDSGAVSSPATAKNSLAVGASENLVSENGLQEKLGDIGGDNPASKPWGAEPIASDTISNNADGIAAFSSRGPTKDKRVKPEVVAPGTNILSTCSHIKGASELWGRYNPDYCFSGGTSMATPLVAGGAGIVRQYLNKKGYQQPSAALMKAVLIHSAKDIYPGQFGENGPEHGQEILKHNADNDQGYGRVDIGNAVTAKLQFVDEKVGLGTGESKVYEFEKTPKKVTLVYTDYPASPAVSATLVNDLDLEVHGDFGISASDSREQNIEQVVLKSSSSATQVVVRAKNVARGNEGKQPYALVISFE